MVAGYSGRMPDSPENAEERQAAREYVKAYQDQPETDEEVQAALVGAVALLATMPWG